MKVEKIVSSTKGMVLKTGTGSEDGGGVYSSVVGSPAIYPPLATTPLESVEPVQRPTETGPCDRRLGVSRVHLTLQVGRCLVRPGSKGKNTEGLHNSLTTTSGFASLNSPGSG